MIQRVILPFLYLILAVVMLAGCGSDNRDEPDPSETRSAGGQQDNGDLSENVVNSLDLAEYANQGSGINLRYPADWLVLEETGTSVTLASNAAFAEGRTPTEPYGMFILSVTGRGMADLPEDPSGVELEAYLSQRFTDFNLPEGSIVVPVAETTVAGLPAASGVVQLDDGTGSQVHNVFTVFVEDDRLVTTLSVAPADARSTFDSLFAAINESVELEAANLALVQGVETQSDLERSHDSEVVYPPDQLPPIGGIHHPFWQNCGIYDEPVVAGQAVHSLEHGAVWITYNPSLPQEEVEHLRDLSRGQPYVLLSPYPDLKSPVVLGAWGVRLELDSALDERVPLFIERYQAGPQTPEPGASCQNGVGDPIEG